MYVSQEMLSDFKKEFELEDYKVCELEKYLSDIESCIYELLYGK